MRLALLSLVLLASAANAEPGAELLAQLREGGYVLFLRHTSTDFSQDDSRMKSFEDCATQRNLTDQGRAEARALGEHVKRLKIPIGEVLASPFCRTMEAARLAFGKARATNDVRGGPLSAVAGPPYLAEGEIAVVRPEGGEKFSVIARLRLDDWQ